MIATFKTYDNTILKEGKIYRWGGFTSGLYTSYKWSGSKCKITKIDGDEISVYDYDDNKEYDYDNKGLEEIGAEFLTKKQWLKKCLKMLK